MTKLETSLLDLLQEDCRLPLEKLAVMTGATLGEVAGAIDDMEKRHIILRYSPMINWDLTDRERVEAMIEVRVTPQRDMGFDAVARLIYRFDEVKSVYLMSGSGAGAYAEGAGLLCCFKALPAGNGDRNRHKLCPETLQGRRRRL